MQGVIKFAISDSSYGDPGAKFRKSDDDGSVTKFAISVSSYGDPGAKFRILRGTAF